MIRIGIVGLGHWGPNYLRIFSNSVNAEIAGCADTDDQRLQAMQKTFPRARLVNRSEDLFADPHIQAVVIATPTHTHYALAEKALSAGQHVLVEKPLALLEQEATALVDFARRQKKILMVGHTFLFNPGVQALREIVQKGELGRLHYFNAVRTNLGPIRQDVNALVDLAPHDISILLHVLGTLPVSVSAQGAAFLHKDREDVAFLTLRFPEDILAQIHVSWLEPVKVRTLTAIGDKKMAVFNDIDPTEPIRIYDKGVSLGNRSYRDFQEFQLIIREGDVVIPKIPFSEPLQNQCRVFLEAVEKGVCPVSDGAFGVQVVRVLEAALQSLKSNGRTIAVPSC